MYYTKRERMDTRLLKAGYRPTGNLNEFRKIGWTVRIDGDMIEVFDDPESGAGKYYHGKINNTNVEQLLREIDEAILL